MTHDFKYYLIEKGTVIAKTRRPKPGKNAQDYPEWIEHLNGCEWIGLSPALEKQLHEKGLREFDEVVQYNDFVLFALPPDTVKDGLK